jgi:murein L,D-transpeptidase YafK
MRHISIVNAALISLTAAVVFCSSLAIANSSKTEQIPGTILKLSGSPFFSRYAFVAEKKSRTLSVWSEDDGRLVKHDEFPIDFGRGGGDKLRTGDMNTPEGIYFLLEHIKSQNLDFEDFGVHSVIAFTTNYPNLLDRRAGKTGYGIWLHTAPESIPLTRGSKGCVIVRSDVIKKLANYVVLDKTPLLIFDEVPNMTENSRKTAVEEFSRRLQQWRNAWERKDINAYMDTYGDAFQSAGMNKDRWRRFKTSLNKSYATINVAISEPSVFAHKDHVVVRFLQSYMSDKKADYGEKTLYWQKDITGNWRIVGETWDAVTNPRAYAVLKPQGELRAPGATVPQTSETMDSTAAMNRDLPKPQSFVK